MTVVKNSSYFFLFISAEKRHNNNDNSPQHHHHHQPHQHPSSTENRPQSHYEPTQNTKGKPRAGLSVQVRKVSTVNFYYQILLNFAWFPHQLEKRESIFWSGRSQGILSRLERSGNFTQNAGKVLGI